jgi:hypothetical protein
MAEMNPIREDQTREERLEIARRYRERRRAELHALAAPHIDGEVIAAGEFSTIATESLAAVPGIGMLLLPLARRRSRRSGLAPKLLLALDAEHLHALELRAADLRRDTTQVSDGPSWPRSEVSAERAGRVLMRDRIDLNVPDRDEPIRLYAPSLITNPWSAEVVRLLGAEAPEPLDLS